MAEIISQETLKEKYYPLYAAALKMLRNPGSVNRKSVEKMMQRTGESPMSPMCFLFSHVVWEEAARIRNMSPSLQPEKYRDAVFDVWSLLRDYAPMRESDAYWDEVVGKVQDITAKYGGSDFIMGLAVDVTLGELEEIHGKCA